MLDGLPVQGRLGWRRTGEDVSAGGGRVLKLGKLLEEEQAVEEGGTGQVRSFGGGNGQERGEDVMLGGSALCTLQCTASAPHQPPRPGHVKGAFAAIVANLVHIDA